MRLILKKTIELVAVAIILVHNHSSGNMRSSDADRHLTQKLKKGAFTLDIKVLDRLIVTEKTYFSFADENML